MPFAQEMAPSLGLSLLKASLTKVGIDSTVLYFTLRFARLLGVASYSQICTDGARAIRERLGDWVFREALFGPDPGNDEAYIREVLWGRAAWPDPSLARPFQKRLLTRARSARSRAARFLADCAAEVLRREPRIVGFTSAFQQHVSSLALAKELKRLRPDLFIVFGGANCEGVMGEETVRAFPFVDAALSGEGEVVFPELVARVLAGTEVDGLPGLFTARRSDAPVSFHPPRLATAVSNLDDLPEPDFDDYFEQFRACPLSRVWEASLFFETSRGCWWGEKSHCTFCGLNGGSMAYRSKSPQRAIDELQGLAEKYPGCDIQVVDNILDSTYFGTFLPELGRRRLGLRLFYETKSNLRQEQVRILADAGIVGIQPGIESFSDSILRRMRKGVTGLQNIQLLKWCRKYGVKPYWNVLWGFPGEPPEEYPRMAELVPSLWHLGPPTGFTGLRLDRFSPGFVDPQQFGFEGIRPLASYRFIFPLREDSIRNLAYFFEFSPADGARPGSYTPPLLKALSRWRRHSAGATLVHADLDGFTVIFDSRDRSRCRVFVLDGLHRAILRYADEVTTLDRLREMTSEFRAGVQDASFADAVDSLLRARLVVKDGDRVLSLSLPLGDDSFTDLGLRLFWAFFSMAGTVEGDEAVLPLSRWRGIRRSRNVRLSRQARPILQDGHPRVPPTVGSFRLMTPLELRLRSSV